MPFITCSILHIPRSRRWKALQAFGRLRMALSGVPGLCFGKAMGCGKGAVFSLSPDWGRYAILAEWESISAYTVFLQSPAWQRLAAQATGGKHLQLQPIHSKGFWDGRQPFQVNKAAAIPQGVPLAVLTRANIRLSKLRTFWQHSAAASKAIEGAPGLLYSLGIGELPFISQATFSIWDGAESMKQYAYRNPPHIAAMQSKQAHSLFTEEMFVRFAVLQEQATAQALVHAG